MVPVEARARTVANSGGMNRGAIAIEKFDLHAAGSPIHGGAHLNNAEAFCRRHSALNTTPAVAAGLTDHVWTVEELVGLPVRKVARIAA